ncbi:uncharacterized protein PV09_06209 [Verruconis gallopava]|uniref:Uncharacterized protein n=1 Tax=Verruconis gallopava TaxID=253628 RepID=A0A0D2ATB7_9PEZI|nr:uncharacterized protein PV09_06209 [Verruconis gallopava]KIW02389.1 hypothetical protein PV09_06209 [Verruconis gallopava]
MLLPHERNLEMESKAHAVIPAVRQLTPPDSPRPSDQKMLPPLPPIKTSWSKEKPQSKASEKMSLDFIAPNSRSPSPEHCSKTLPRLEVLSAAAAIHRGSRPSSPFLPINTVPTHSVRTSHTSSQLITPQPPRDEYYTPVSAATSGLPSPVWSNFSELLPLHMRDSLVFNQSSLRDRRSSAPTYNANLDNRSQHCSPPPARPTRVQKRAQKPSQTHIAARGERHPYDAEERFALVYLRREVFEKKLEWKDVLVRFHILFPPGAPRRYKSKDGNETRGLPPCYTQREVQGLQCRFYRIRTEEGLPKSRDAAGFGGIDTPAARAAIEDELSTLERIAIRDNLCPNFVKRVKQLAAKGDLNEILAYSHVRL